MTALPDMVQNLDRYLVRGLNALHRRDLLPDTQEAVAARLTDDFRNSLGVVTNNILGRTVGIVFGTFSYALTLFAVIFIAASLLANVRSYKAAYLTSVSAGTGVMRFRSGMRLDMLCRGSGGLALVLAIQGVLSATALFLMACLTRWPSERGYRLRPSSPISERGSARSRRSGRVLDLADHGSSNGYPVPGDPAA